MSRRPRRRAALRPRPDEGAETLRDAQVLRRFKQSDSLYFQLYVYNALPDEKGATDVVLQAQIRSGANPIAASKPQAVTFQQKDGLPLPQSNGMSLESLAPGSYELRVVVVDRKANATAFTERGLHRGVSRSGQGCSIFSDLVGLHVLQLRHAAVGPPHLDQVRLLRRAEPEVEALVLLRDVARAAPHEVASARAGPPSPGRPPRSPRCSGPCPRARRSASGRRRRARCAGPRGLPSRLLTTTSSRPSLSRSPTARPLPDAQVRHHRPELRGHLLELPLPAVVVEELALPVSGRGAHRHLVHLRVDVPVHHDEVQQAVVVVVEERGAPLDERQAGWRPSSSGRTRR